MKILLYLIAIALIALSGCNKTSINQVAAGGWQLVQKQYSIANSGLRTTKPSADSSVLLVLNADGTYNSQLNGQTVSQGSYAITTDSSYYKPQILQLNNFVTTGLFSVFVMYQIGTDGQVLSSYDGMVMKTSNDTLTLANPPTFGGYEIYTFVKK